MKKYEGIVEHSFEYIEQVRNAYGRLRAAYPIFDPREKLIWGEP